MYIIIQRRILGGSFPSRISEIYAWGGVGPPPKKNKKCKPFLEKNLNTPLLISLMSSSQPLLICQNTKVKTNRYISI